ncbi:MAG: chromate resistance protein ChrB [Oscillospiraceae bacterium]|nr:chromate resistance protein ChrB [Oscillospiraceae bacterium]
MEKIEWLMLNFTLPKEPSRVRVSAWRKLKKSGSVNIGQSMWVLPMTDGHIDVFTEISDDILQNGGEAYILKADFINIGNAKDITEFFNTARDEEYKEFLKKCNDFFHKIEKKINRINYTFAKVEENEHELEKLGIWIAKITARDFFEAPLKVKAQKMLTDCRNTVKTLSVHQWEPPR